MGILYTSSAMLAGGQVKYKFANYIVSYTLATIVSGFMYNDKNNSVEVRTQELSDLSNQVKVIWAKKNARSDTIELKNYFTPLVKLVGFRCN
jgi:hypothetical protein